MRRSFTTVAVQALDVGAPIRFQKTGVEREVVIRVLSAYGLTAGRLAGHPGVWVNGNKIAAVGIAVRDRITRHGLALNVAPQMAHFDLLIPDFNGSRAALETVLAAGPDVLNHNLETVPRLYPQVRPRADYRRSLGVLAWAKACVPQMLTKSGLMLGLGERRAEILRVLYDDNFIELLSKESRT